MLFYLSGTSFVDVRLRPFPQGLDPYRKAAMGDASPLCGTDQCPAVTAPDGTHCVETTDIMRFVGQQVGCAPEEGSAAAAKAWEIELLAQNILNKVFYKLFVPMITVRVLQKQGLSCLSPVLLGSES